MLLLVSGATKYKRNETVGHLIVPRQWNDADALELHPRRWAMDNGAFTGFDEGAFVRMLERFHKIPGCLFATAPDFVGDAASTRARWPFWSKLIRGLGLTPAFVAQDGIQSVRDVPWHDDIALFIGGTTEFKESPLASDLIGYAKARGVWAHVGRVNGKRRYAMMLRAGADSIDGTGFSMYPDTNIPLAEEWRAETQQQPRLLENPINV
jgi:hypothetical protein